MDIIEALKYNVREKGKEGLEKGRLQTKEALVTNMIVELGLTDEQTAKVADVEINFIQQVRQNLENNSHQYQHSKQH